jgi:hypothetical protein
MVILKNVKEILLPAAKPKMFSGTNNYFIELDHVLMSVSNVLKSCHEFNPVLFLARASKVNVYSTLLWKLEYTFWENTSIYSWTDSWPLAWSWASDTGNAAFVEYNTVSPLVFCLHVIIFIAAEKFVGALPIRKMFYTNNTW